ncbi:TerD family protein [Streptomyces sp. NPDC051018]|uniref:TerD family protein n=1 Tax=Streptomyces sp. NPDC051018 TaxID=3365639 RepID=UPI0037ABB5FA
MTNIPKGANAPVPTARLRVAVGHALTPTTPAVDAVALLLDGRGTTRPGRSDVVSSQGTLHPSRAVGHMGSTTGNGQFAVWLDVDLPVVEAEIQRVLIIALSGGAAFGSVPGLYVQASGQDGMPVARYTVTDAANETAFVLGEFYRRDGAWKFRAMGQGYASGIQGVIADYGTEAQQPGPGGQPPLGGQQPGGQPPLGQQQPGGQPPLGGQHQQHPPLHQPAHPPQPYGPGPGPGRTYAPGHGMVDPRPPAPQPPAPQPGHPQPGVPQHGFQQPGGAPGQPQHGFPQPHPQPGYPQPGHQQPGHPQPYQAPGPQPGAAPPYQTPAPAPPATYQTPAPAPSGHPYPAPPGTAQPHQAGYQAHPAEDRFARFPSFPPQTIRGHGNDKVTFAAPIPAGPVIVELAHRGDGWMSVYQLNQRHETGGTIASTMSPDFHGRAPAIASDRHPLRLEIMAEDDWTATVRPVSTARRLGSVAVHGDSYEVLAHNGPDIDLEVEFLGPRHGPDRSDNSLTLLAMGIDNIWYEDADFGDVDYLLTSAVGPFRQTVRLRGGPRLLAVEAEGLWTITPRPGG